MKASTLLLRQVHPSFFPNGILSSQAFVPFPKDEGKLSVYDSDMISVEEAYKHYTEALGYQSAGVWGVTCSEIEQERLTSESNPLENFPAHALINFGTASKNECRKLAKRLKMYAENRGCLHAEGS